MQLSKTDFLQFLHCPKSLWLLRRKPTLYQHGPFSDYLQKIVSEGYEIELYLKSLFSSQTDSLKYSYQTGFKTGDGLYAIADCTRQNDDGSIDIYEVKSSTSVQRGSPQNQIKDASFQKITAEDVRDVAKKYLTDDFKTVAILTPLARASDGEK